MTFELHNSVFLKRFVYGLYEYDFSKINNDDISFLIDYLNEGVDYSSCKLVEEKYTQFDKIKLYGIIKKINKNFLEPEKDNDFEGKKLIAINFYVLLIFYYKLYVENVTLNDLNISYSKISKTIIDYSLYLFKNEKLNYTYGDNINMLFSKKNILSRFYFYDKDYYLNSYLNYSILMFLSITGHFIKEKKVEEKEIISVLGKLRDIIFYFDDDLILDIFNDFIKEKNIKLKINIDSYICSFNDLNCNYELNFDLLDNSDLDKNLFLDIISCKKELPILKIINNKHLKEQAIILNKEDFIKSLLNIHVNKKKEDLVKPTNDVKSLNQQNGNLHIYNYVKSIIQKLIELDYFNHFSKNDIYNLLNPESLFKDKDSFIQKHCIYFAVVEVLFSHFKLNFNYKDTKITQYLIDFLLHINFELNDYELMDKEFSEYNFERITTPNVSSYLLISDIVSDILLKSNLSLYTDIKNTIYNYIKKTCEYTEKSIINVEHKVMGLLSMNDISCLNKNIFYDFLHSYLITLDNKKLGDILLKTFSFKTTEIDLKYINSIKREILSHLNNNKLINKNSNINHDNNKIENKITIDNKLISEIEFISHKNYETFLKNNFDVLDLDKSSEVGHTQRAFKSYIEKNGRLRNLNTINDNILKKLDDLYNDFPHFEKVINYIKQNLYLQNYGNKLFYFRPILLNGESGIGKTFFSSQIAKIAGMPYEDLYAPSLKGIDLHGQSSVYINNKVGVILRNLLEIDNPSNMIFLIDEIDKISRHDTSSASLENILLKLLDENSSKEFTDISCNVNVNASYINWILTSNETDSISVPFLNRLNLFNVPNPNKKELYAFIQAIYKNILFNKNDIKTLYLKHFSDTLPDETTNYLVELFYNKENKLKNKLSARNIKQTINNMFYEAMVKEDTNKLIELKPKHNSSMLDLIFKKL